jgi:hypothetical protein
LGRSDRDIDSIGALDNIVFLEPQLAIDDMATIGQMEFIAVPRAHDVDVTLIEGLSKVNSAIADKIHHLRHLEAFASRAALVRAEIAIGIVFAGVPNDPDFQLSGFDQPNPAIGDLTILANKHIRHQSSPFVTYRAVRERE